MAKRYMTAVIELPEDQTDAKAVMAALPLFGTFRGGTITAVYAGDAISENEIFEASADPILIKAVRDQVAART